MNTLGPDTKFTRSLSIRVHRTHGIPIWKGPVTNRRFPLTLEMNRTKIPRDDSFARQRGLVGYSLNDKEWTDDLFIAS
jgi:hypothetical protein